MTGSGWTEVKFSATFCPLPPLQYLYDVPWTESSPPPCDSENWIYSRIDKPSHKSVYYRLRKVLHARITESILHADCAHLSARAIHSVPES